MSTADQADAQSPGGSSVDDFGLFAQAGEAVQAEDVLDRTEIFVRTGLDQVKAVERISATFAGSGHAGVFAGVCSPAGMASALWQHACRDVESHFVRPIGVEVGNVERHIAVALGWKEPQRPSYYGARDAAVPSTELVWKWSASRIRAHFAVLVGDPREKRIHQLRDKVLHAIRYERPEAKWVWRSGEHHQEWLCHRSSLRLTYSSDNLRNIENVFRYVIHLATGEDPSTIKLPVIYAFNDGQEQWPASKVYLRQKEPFPGANWIRFTAGWAIEISLIPAVLSRLQAQWDEKHAAAAA